MKHWNSQFIDSWCNEADMENEYFKFNFNYRLETTKYMWHVEVMLQMIVPWNWINSILNNADRLLFEDYVRLLICKQQTDFPVNQFSLYYKQIQSLSMYST